MAIRKVYIEGTSLHEIAYLFQVLRDAAAPTKIMVPSETVVVSTETGEYTAIMQHERVSIEFEDEDEDGDEDGDEEIPLHPEH